MRWRSLVAAVAVVLPLLCLPVQSAEAAGLTPAGNIAAVPAYTGACQATPRSAPCQAAAISALNRGRAIMRLPAYALPANFTALPPQAQLLYLSNSDRAVYGLAPITGLNAALSVAAQAGVSGDRDPAGVSSLAGAPFRGWSSNWAAGWSSVLYVYYEWMYDDGVGGTNLECRHAGDAGCWGHRTNVLFRFAAGSQIAMGVGVGVSPRYHLPAYTALYEAVSAAAPVRYTYQATPVTVAAPRRKAVVIARQLGAFTAQARARLADRTSVDHALNPRALMQVVFLGAMPTTITVW